LAPLAKKDGVVVQHIEREDFSFKGYDQQPPGLSKPGFFLASFAAIFPPPAAAFPLYTEIFKLFYILV
jgi:hypothetical protein